MATIRDLTTASCLRVVFVLLGAAFALALGVAAFTLLALASEAGAPTWAVALLAILLVGGPLLVGLIPVVRQLEGVAAHGLLGVRFPDGMPGPAHGRRQRGRSAAWFVVHLLAGAVPVAAVVGLIGLGASVWTVPAALATVVLTVLLGHLLAVVAPAVLGPSYAERLQRLEADAARASERNRLAREIHDSIGHALSLVTVQAGAARKLLVRDPAFAAEALTTIETTSRRAVADLDHVLGLLRDEPGGSDPTPTLGEDSLEGLVAAAGAAGLRVERTVRGDLSRLPLLVAREGYRIVQEGLTNAAKYSADGSATVSIVLDDGRLEIRVTNPARPGERRSGRGLRGIGERAETLGGTSSAAPDEGRWLLAVDIPVGLR